MRSQQESRREAECARTIVVARAEGYMDVYSENAYGVCVPLNSSANEVIIGMARAAALSGSGDAGNGSRLSSLQ